MVCVEVSTLLFIYVQAGAWLLYPATAVLVTVFWNRKEKKTQKQTEQKRKGKKKEQKKGNEATEQERVSAMDRT